MRTTVELDDALVERAQEYAPGLTKRALLEEGLRALVREEATRRILEMAGSQPDMVVPPRRKVS